MIDDLEEAKIRLKENKDAICVMVKKDFAKNLHNTRTVYPEAYDPNPNPLWFLLGDLEQGKTLEGFSVADRITGKAAASLYALLKPAKLYSEIVSRTALQVYEEAGIDCTYSQVVDKVLNKDQTDDCPMEKAVKDAKTPQEAYQILLKMRKAAKPEQGPVEKYQIFVEM
jgi:hypothetical protein